MFLSIPWYISITLIVLSVVVVSLFCLIYIKRRTDQNQLREDQELTSYALNTISLFYCLLVGLVVMDVQNGHNSIQDGIVKEASIVMDMYHTGKAFPFLNQKLIEKALREYAQNVIEVELPAMQEGKDYAMVRYAHPNSLWQAISALEPQDYKELAVYQSMLNRMNQLTEARFERFSSVDGRTTKFLWVVLIYGALIVIGCSLMFASKSSLSHALHLSFNVSLLALILVLIFALDSPFNGPTSVQLTAFEKVMKHIDIDGESRNRFDRQ